MILGTTAVQLLAAMGSAPASAGPFWLPAAATAHLDFVNGNYYAGGAERAVTDLLGSAFDSGRIDASGLLLELAPNLLDITAIGALSSDILALLASSGCTVVFDFTMAGAVEYPEGPMVYFFDDADPDAATKFQELKPRTGTPFQRSFNFAGDVCNLDGSTPNLLTDTGTQVIAATMNVPLGGGLYRWGGACNANEGQSDDVAVDLLTEFASIERINLFAVGPWDYGMEDVYCRRLTVFPGVSDMTELGAMAVPYALP